MVEHLSARNLAKHGMRRGAYDGARRRRFVLFVSNGDGTEQRHEYDTKGERDRAALDRLLPERCPTCAAPVASIFDHVDRDCKHD